MNELLVRCYVADKGSASVRLPARNVEMTAAGRHYPVHFDPHFATVIITLPTTGFVDGLGGELVVCDPACEKPSQWRQ